MSSSYLPGRATFPPIASSPSPGWEQTVLPPTPFLWNSPLEFPVQDGTRRANNYYGRAPTPVVSFFPEGRLVYEINGLAPVLEFYLVPEASS